MPRLRDPGKLLDDELKQNIRDEIHEYARLYEFTAAIPKPEIPENPTESDFDKLVAYSKVRTFYSNSKRAQLRLITDMDKISGGQLLGGNKVPNPDREADELDAMLKDVEDRLG
ncbi:hypothetical protein V5T82_07310 [Magnetovibrio sp. PR-2]|uniref:hypothetical protein n=1 Tax=Magnetovibrio sp. PR-2 TaxID=3120356 RepID=UPI002FCE2DCB